MKSVRLHTVGNLQTPDESVPVIDQGEIGVHKGCGYMWFGLTLVFRRWDR